MCRIKVYVCNRRNTLDVHHRPQHYDSYLTSNLMKVGVTIVKVIIRLERLLEGLEDSVGGVVVELHNGQSADDHVHIGR